MFSMKHYLLAVFMFLSIHTCIAQECPENFMTILNDDDTAALAEVVTPDNINLCCEDGYTMISHAIRIGSPNCFEWLLKQKADVNARCGVSKPPIYLACKYGDLKMFKKLEEKGADLKAHYGDGLLEYAIKYNNTDIVNYLKQKK